MTAIPDQEAWNAWHPRELAERLGGVDRPWCVVGGWALDLWHGRETREHHDLEFTVLREDFGALRRRLRGGNAFSANFIFYTVSSGVFDELPDDQVPDLSISQIWCWDIVAGTWRVDIMIEPGTADTWVCKRDHAITLPRAEAVRRTADGVPYLDPAAILLLKAKHQRPKDEVDLATALPTLSPSQRRWLHESVARLHPDHDWLQVI